MADPIQYVSPTGAAIVGTLERLSGKALIDGIDPDTGLPEWAGETEIYWDDQVTATLPHDGSGKGGGIIFLDENGAEWTFDQLTPAGDDDVVSTANS